MAATRDLSLALGSMAVTNEQLGVGMWTFCMGSHPAWGLVKGVTTHCEKRLVTKCYIEPHTCRLL
jgi:hypothetical protein